MPGSAQLLFEFAAKVQVIRFSNAPVLAGSKYDLLTTSPWLAELLLVEADPKKKSGSPGGFVKPKAVTRISKLRAEAVVFVKTSCVRSSVATTPPGELVVAAVRALVQLPTGPVYVNVVPFMSPPNPPGQPPIPLSHVTEAPPVTSVSVIRRTVASAGGAVSARVAPAAANIIERRFILTPLSPED